MPNSNSGLVPFPTDGAVEIAQPTLRNYLNSSDVARTYSGGSAVDPSRIHQEQERVLRAIPSDYVTIQLHHGTKITVEGADLLVGEIEGGCSFRVPLAAFRRNLV